MPLLGHLRLVLPNLAPGRTRHASASEGLSEPAGPGPRGRVSALNTALGKERLRWPRQTRRVCYGDALTAPPRIRARKVPAWVSIIGPHQMLLSSRLLRRARPGPGGSPGTPSTLRCCRGAYALRFSRCGVGSPLSDSRECWAGRGGPRSERRSTLVEDRRLCGGLLSTTRWGLLVAGGEHSGSTYS